MISGVEVFRDCWNYRDTYDCVLEEGYNYCSAIDRTPGCNLTSQRVDGGVMTNIYTCGSNTIAPGGNVIVLNDTHTIKTDSGDWSECASVADNPSCRLANQTCVQQGEERTLDGSVVLTECQKWDEEYTCQINNTVDYCSPLASFGCTLIKQECKGNSPIDGTCYEYEYFYQCGTPPPSPPVEVVYLDSSYSIINDSVVSQCQTEESSPYCELSAETCVEDAGMRNINGLDIYKSCWAWKRNYVCTQNTPISDCDELASTPSCEEIASQCIEMLTDGRCSVFEHEYKCLVGEPYEHVVQNCQTQRYCMDGKCYDTGYSPDTDFGKVASMMEAMNEFSYGLFAGEARSCASKKAWGLSNCCKSNHALARKGNNASMMTTTIKVGAEVIRAMGSEFVYTGLMESGVNALMAWASQEAFTRTIDMIRSNTWPEDYGMGDQIAQMMPSFLQEQVLYTSGIDAGLLQTGGWLAGNPTFSYYGLQLSFSYSATAGWSMAISFNPVGLIIAVVMQVIMDMMECDQSDIVTGSMRGEGLCHKIGSWCASRSLGSCSETREGHCCFASKLARIIQEQGRAQLGKGWGRAKEPSCETFTKEEFARIDFDRIDFSEFLADIMRALPTGKGPGYAQDRVNERIQDTINSLGSYYDQ